MAGYSGDGSYEKLIANVYGINKTNIGITQSYKEYNLQVRIQDISAQLFTSFVYSGFINYSNNVITRMFLGTGIYWESRAYQKQRTRNLYLTPSTLYTQSYNYYDYKGEGLSVRCVAKSYFFLPVMLLTLSAPKGGE